MRGPQVLIVVLLLAVVVMGGLAVNRYRQQPQSNSVLVYAPCGLQGPLQLAVTMFRQRHPEVTLEVKYDNANVLVRRVLKQGDRPDVFVSPGELELSQVAKANLIDAQTVRDFGSLDMVLITPAKVTDIKKVEDLTRPGVKTVALGDPAFNSVGFYGQEVLKARKVWDAVEPKLMLREYPLEAFNLVAQGAAQAGFAYLTCPLDTNPEKASKSDVRIVEKIARELYGPIRLQAGMLNTSTQRKGGQVFIDFLASKEAQQAMSKDGLLPVEVLR